MLCHLTRWFISRSEDGGKAWPRFAERHAARCAACQEYARFASVLAQAPETDLTFEGVDAEGARSGRRASGRRPVFLRPFPLASAALALVAFVLVLAQAVLREPGLSPADRQAAFAALRSVTTAPDEIGGPSSKCNHLSTGNGRSWRDRSSRPSTTCRLVSTSRSREGTDRDRSRLSIISGRKREIRL